MKTDLKTLARVFKKSSHSINSPDGMRCVGVALSKEDVLLKNLSNPNSATLSFTPDEWQAFIAGVKEGEFDLPK